MGTSAASEPLNFFIIVIYDLCIGYRSYITIINIGNRSYITIINELIVNERKE